MKKKPAQPPPEPLAVLCRRGGTWEAVAPNGETVRYLSRAVWSPEELEAALAEGWFRSLADMVTPPPPPPVEVQEAIAAAQAPEPEPLPVPTDDEPPTRAELEEKAQELGIKVDRRWSDRRLAETVERAIEAQE